MLKRLLFTGLLLTPVLSNAQGLTDLFRLAWNIGTLASLPADADPTPPTQFTWDPLPPSPAKAAAATRQAKHDIGALTTRIRQSPDSVELLVARGRLHGRVGNAKQALADLSAAAAKGSHDPLLNLYLAQASLLSGQGEAAEKYLRQQRQQTPNRPEPDLFEARLWLARPGILSQNCKQALPVLEKAVALDSTNATARQLRGYAYFANNKYGPAMRDYQAVLAQNPTDERTHFYMGQALVGAGQTSAACPHFTQGEAFAPAESRWYLKKYCR